MSTTHTIVGRSLLGLKMTSSAIETLAGVVTLSNRKWRGGRVARLARQAGFIIQYQAKRRPNQFLPFPPPLPGLSAPRLPNDKG